MAAVEEKRKHSHLWVWCLAADLVGSAKKAFHWLFYISVSQGWSFKRELASLCPVLQGVNPAGCLAPQTSLGTPVPASARGLGWVGQLKAFPSMWESCRAKTAQEHTAGHETSPRAAVPAVRR